MNSRVCRIFTKCRILINGVPEVGHSTGRACFSVRESRISNSAFVLSERSRALFVLLFGDVQVHSGRMKLGGNERRSRESGVCSLIFRGFRGAFEAVFGLGA